MKHPIDEGQQAQDPNELPDQEPDTREPIVLGSQLARAMAMNKSHRKSQPPIPSQLASIEYSRVAGETDLLRFIESPTDQIIRSLIEE